MYQAVKVTGKQRVLFLFWWTLATTAAWAIVVLVNTSLNTNTDDSFLHRWFGPLWLDGLIVGILQWLVLRQQLRHALLWAAATWLSFMMAGIYVFFGGAFWMSTVLLYIGLAFFQWLVLRRQVPRALVWFPITGVACLSAALMAALPILAILFAGENPLACTVLGISMGGTIGVITGAALLLLFQQKSVTPNEQPAWQKPTLYLLVLLVILVLVTAPLFAGWQTYTLQSRIYCNDIQLGMSHTAVNTSLSKIRSYSESGASYLYSQAEHPVPQELAAYSDQVTNFVTVQIQDPWLDFKRLGFGYDKDDKLTLITASTFTGIGGPFQVIQCPRTVQSFLNSLNDK